MNKAIAIVIALAPISAHATKISTNTYQWNIVKVIDAGTFEVDAGKDMPPELSTMVVRVKGISYPVKETAKCNPEREMAFKVNQYSFNVLYEAHKKAFPITFHNIEWGLQGVEADIYYGGENLSEVLIKANLAKPKPSRIGEVPNWCSTN